MEHLHESVFGSQYSFFMRFLRTLAFTALVAVIGVLPPLRCRAEAQPSAPVVVSDGELPTPEALRDFGAEVTLEADTRQPPSVLTDSLEDRGLPALPGKDRPVSPPGAPQEKRDEAPDGKPQLDPSATTSALNVNEVEISSLIKTFSKLTGRNYVVDNSVKGKITILQPTPVSLEEALRILESVLLLKGFTTVPLGKNTYKVVPAREARQTTIPLVMDRSGSPTDALVTQLIRLRYVQAEELQPIVSQFISKDGLVNPFVGTNSLILIDSAANIERLIEIIKQLDVPAIDQDITIIPIEHAEAADIAEKILNILGEKEGDARGKGMPAPTPRVPTNIAAPTGVSLAGSQAMAAAAAARAAGERRLPLKVIPDERTNSLIVVADAEMTAKVRALTEQLDSAVDRSGGRFYVYRLKHADAEELADILSSLISGSAYERSSPQRSQGSSLSRSSRERRAESSSLLGGSRSSSLGALGRGTPLSPARGQLRSSATSGSGEGSKVSFESEVSIAPDVSTNSLIINASRSDFAKLKEVIDALDIKRRQVIVEATILEVSLDASEGLGVELQGTLAADEGGMVAQSNFGGLGNILKLSDPGVLSDLTIAAASVGTITLPGGITIPSQAALVSAVSRNSNVNVLSSPTILTTDNEEAEIVVGQNVPFLTGTSTDTTNLNNTFNQIERQDVGITLRITPQISTGDFVRMRIFVEISDVVTGTQRDPNGPTTTVRTTETTVEVKDNQMVVTGGLIADSVTQATRGVPFFEDIPVLGHFFKRQDELRRRTNLLVFLTPKILRDQFDAREDALTRRAAMRQAIGEQLDPELERRNVLESKNLNTVAEELPPPAVSPSTMTGPTPRNPLGEQEHAAVNRLQQRFRALGAGELTVTPPATTTHNSSPDLPPPRVAQDGDEISITVTPRLPSLPTQEEPSVTRRSSDHQAGIAPRPTHSAVLDQATYVVLRDISGKSPAGMPLPYADAQGTVGIIIPGDRGSASAQFFEAGRRYSLDTREGRRSFVCLGRYRSLSEARIVHPQLNSPSKWSPLPPHEILNLGRGAWRRT